MTQRKFHKTIVSIDNVDNPRMLEAKQTPMMAQWQACKKRAADALLLFRMGDFYEAFYEDAEILSDALDLTLTKRQGIPMSGVPHHTLDNYLDRLIEKGFKVALAEQTEDPKKAKGLVKREVVRILSPGALVSSNLLKENIPHFFVAITQLGSTYGLAIVDLTCNYFACVEFDRLDALFDEIFRLSPKEILLSVKFTTSFAKELSDARLATQFTLTSIEDWRFDHAESLQMLLGHFHVLSLDGFGLKGMSAAIIAAGTLLSYLQDTLCHNIAQIDKIQTYTTKSYLSLDRITLTNLELVDAKSPMTLLHVLDETITPMGGRLLYFWVKRPLFDLTEIHRRQESVEDLVKNPFLLSDLRTTLLGIKDIERILSRIISGYGSAKDMLMLAASLEKIPLIHDLLDNATAPLLRKLQENLPSLQELTTPIRLALVEDPPNKLGEGSTFRKGYNTELDEWLLVGSNSKTWMAHYQQALRTSTGIKTLKVSYNRIFGYYIEVSKGQADNMPAVFQRRQTLANSERFISDELKEYEIKVLQAEEKIIEIERKLFDTLKEKITSHSSSIKQIAEALATLDSLQSLAHVAIEHNYVKPECCCEDVLEINKGRHPIIEAYQNSEPFIPNDTALDRLKESMMLITGPNMAGKSTYIRQVALIVIMAQIGSFVPAHSARIGLVDKIFTRIGASDDLARGQSTFMVEMAETANIINNATEKSLVILDEIGRGTSTYDGISIAWAVAEYFLQTKKIKTLFATHYFELTRLENSYPHLVNYTVKVAEDNHKAVFLHKIVKGKADRSYGIHVAQLAGIPPAVIHRAQEILFSLEEDQKKIKNVEKDLQLTLFPMKTSPKKAPHAIIEKLKDIDTNHITPLEALTMLSELQKECLSSRNTFYSA